MPDPRVKVTSADFQAEFALARQIEAARVRAHTALAEAGGRQAALAAQIQAAAPPAKAELQALAARLGAIADISADSARKAVGRTAPSAQALSDIAEQLDKLAAAVDGADGAPTPDAIDGFAQTSRALDAALARWEALKPALPPGGAG